jgi:hypothetical protein
MAKRKIKHNDLLPWFTMDHGQLPASYLKSCAEFFEWLNWQSGNRFKATSNKPQAASVKLLPQLNDKKN